jgi:hypothetical protein
MPIERIKAKLICFFSFRFWVIDSRSSCWSPLSQLDYKSLIWEAKPHKLGIGCFYLFIYFWLFIYFYFHPTRLEPGLSSCWRQGAGGGWKLGAQWNLCFFYIKKSFPLDAEGLNGLVRSQPKATAYEPSGSFYFFKNLF